MTQKRNDNNVIEFRMEVFDVIFPVNIGPLSYRCPEALSGMVKPGMMVSAPLKNRITKGIVAGKSISFPKQIKDIRQIHGAAPVFSTALLTLLKWMSEYYIAEQGLVLKNMLPKEAFAPVKQRKTAVLPDTDKEERRNDVQDISFLDENAAAELRKSMESKTYRTFLLHSPSLSYEYSFLTTVIEGAANVIILVPEVTMVGNIYCLLNKVFGERVCLFHSELSKGRRADSIERILSGRSDIVLGTRSAVFAPLKTVSLIAVLEEHGSSYKQEKMPCYNARDVAVMRGYTEKATVLLSSVCPSIDSFSNAKSGKYTLLERGNEKKRPKVRIINMRYEKLLRPYLSKAVVDASARHIRNERRILFVINRRGYATCLQCIDCSHVEECPACKIPLVFHKQGMSMKCHYCGYALTTIPDRCPKCKGYHLQLLGAGTQRIQEDLEKLTGLQTMRFDSDKAKKQSEVKKLMGASLIDENRILIGTKLMAKRLGAGGFSMAAVLNTDLLLNLPDFRAAEKAYQEIASIIDKIEPDGEIFIQTRMPQNYLYPCLKNDDYVSFFKEELQRRQALNYPPYARLLLMRFLGEKDMSKELQRVMQKTNQDLEILGPYSSKNKKGESEVRLLLRSPVRGKLQSTAKFIMEAFKGSKDVDIKIDVDPIVI
jgi:primosomal protein N' (replication factor Y) (superfamily II helicase)